MKKLYITIKCEKVELNIGHILEVFLHFTSSNKILALGDLVNSVGGDLKT